MSHRSRHKHPYPSAKTADRYALYVKAVQTPESEVAFVDRIYRRLNKRPPVVLREDFCGTGAITCEWVGRARDHVGVGIDIDPEPLAWGDAHHRAALDEDQQARATFVEADVLTYEGPAVDAILAVNFSFCVFKERETLLRYATRCREALTSGGLLVMDIYGGPEAQQVQEDVNQREGFAYIWQQAAFNPLTSEALNYIHFRFRDGSRMERAFRYDWRLWTLRELAEVLKDAGFAEATVYWEDTEQDGTGSGVFRPRRKAEVEAAWVAYIVGWTG